MEGPTDRYVQFISKLDRKDCRLLVGLLTGHINLLYMLHKMRRAETPSRWRCGAEKETSVYILCECAVLEKVTGQTVSFPRMDPEQIKGARLSAIHGPTAEWPPMNQWASGPESWDPNGNPSRKNENFKPLREML